jgi:hypothetical protein
MPAGGADVSLGQRVTSAIVDVVFFAVVWSLARSRVVEGQAVVGLLSMYAGARFGIAHGKQQTIVAMARHNDRDPPGGSGSSQEMPAVRVPPRRDPRVDEPWSKRDIAAASPLIAVLRTIGGVFL